jgi:large conductance mechanosensitive channel
MARTNGGFWADFQKFLMRGNVVDLAVAVIIGAAFGRIVTSFVEDIITPVILSPVLTRLNINDLENLSYNGIKYGVFLAAVINFIVIAFAIFIMIRAFEKAKRRFARKEAIAEDTAAPDQNLILQERVADALDRLARALESRNL